MTGKGYAVLGWIVYQIAIRLMKSRVRNNKHKLTAAAAVVLVLIAGVAAKNADSRS